jgi:AMMECR1 domain-containing protein
VLCSARSDRGAVNRTGVDPSFGRVCHARENGKLRGCIGQMRADTLLYRVVSEMAVAAVTSDPRFPPPKAEELSKLHIGVSVLRRCVASRRCNKSKSALID